MKEKLIIQVARFGTYPKNTELLLDVLSSINLKDWKVVLAGPVETVEQDFQKKIDIFFNQHPDLRGKISFVGNISRREELFGLYRKASVYLNTSRWESFGISMLEAAYFNNFLISPDVGAAIDIIHDDKYGEIIPQGNKDAFVESLQKIIDNYTILNFTSDCNQIIKSKYGMKKISSMSCFNNFFNSEKKKLVLCLPWIELLDVYLVKDVGLFPEYFHSVYGIPTEIVCLGNSECGTNKKIENDIEISIADKSVYPSNFEIPTKFTQLFKIIHFLKPLRRYIKENAKSISHLMLFHITKKTIILALLAKTKNPQIKIYVKGDTQFESGLKQKVLFVFLIKIIDLFSCETQLSTELFKKKYKKYASKIYYVPNGIAD